MQAATEIFTQQNGDVTKAYYAAMNANGLPGQLAVALFRAQKRSTAAKRYKGRRFTQDAYSVKIGRSQRFAAFSPRCRHLRARRGGDGSVIPKRPAMSGCCTSISRPGNAASIAPTG